MLSTASNRLFEDPCERKCQQPRRRRTQRQPVASLRYVSRDLSRKPTSSCHAASRFVRLLHDFACAKMTIFTLRSAPSARSRLPLFWRREFEARHRWTDGRSVTTTVGADGVRPTANLCRGDAVGKRISRRASRSFALDANLDHDRTSYRCRCIRCAERGLTRRERKNEPTRA